MKDDAIFKEIAIERERQDRIWGGQDHDAIHTAHDWVAYLTKHVGKSVHWPWTPERFRQQMVIIGALSVAAVRWCDTRTPLIEKPSV
jgi:hypothetical protein